MSLIIHCGGSVATMDEIKQTETPPATMSHFPIPHFDFVQEIKEQLGMGRLTITEEVHALSKEGQRYFGLFRVKPQDTLSLPGLVDDDTGGLCVGARNAHDKAFRAELVVGHHTTVCDNLLFTGEINIGRKHTRHARRDLRRMTSDAMGRMVGSAVKQQQRVECYKEAELDDKSAHDLIVRAVDAQAMTATQLPRVLKEWREPSHEQFLPRNAWSLVNAFTEVYRQDGKLDLTRKRSLHLTNMVDSYLALGT